MGQEDYVLFLGLCKNPLIAIEDVCFKKDGKIQKLTYLNQNGTYEHELKVIKSN
jgi:hypothetical protein